VDEITFWAGQRLSAYQLSVSGTTVYFTLKTTLVYFGSKLISKGTYNSSGSGDYVTLAPVAADRLGSIGKFYPYGTERPSATANDKEKFTGYFRDQSTGLDYADQRYEQSGMGRFMTPDPYGRSANANDPGSWNKYAYVGGDPVNLTDPQGLLEYCPACGFVFPEQPWITSYDCPDMYSCSLFGDVGLLWEPFLPQQAKLGHDYGDIWNKAIQDGFTDAFNRLSLLVNGTGDCGSLFGDGAIEKMVNTEYRIADLGGPTSQNGKWSVTGAATMPDKTTVYINTSGPYLDQSILTSDGKFTPFTIGGLTGTAFQGFLLLHELAHELGLLGSDNASMGFDTTASQ